MTPNLPDRPGRNQPPGWTERLRPQICLAMFCVTVLSGFGCWLGAYVMNPAAPEIVSGSLGMAVSGLLALGMKVLEPRD